MPSARPHGLGAVDWANAAEFVPGRPYTKRAGPVKAKSPVPLVEDFETDRAVGDKELRTRLCPYAAEFVPGQPYCGRAKHAKVSEKDRAVKDTDPKNQLCPHAALGECCFGLGCAYLHGDVCDMCGLQALHPTDHARRSEHTEACIEAHEKDRVSFAMELSRDMTCGVCMEVVFEKARASERRFGILSNCSHCYCLRCISKWFKRKVVKSCPECRITSNFVIPSEYWVKDKDDKEKLIQKYKDSMGRKPCWYFAEGRGSCPFRSNCFYKHAFHDGRLEEDQPRWKPPGSNRRRQNSRRTTMWYDEEMVTLDEMLLMLLAVGTDDDTDCEYECDLFHEEIWTIAPY